MSRKERKMSGSGVYHVVIKGVDRQDIFIDTRDYYKYLDVLSLYKEECKYEIYAYCLMTNHVHIIIKENEVPLETIFRKLNTHYAMWFNKKYEREGHLQQDRFYSEPIETEAYLLTAIRYIHQNPIKAGIESEIGKQYRWSSYKEYERQKSTLTDIKFPLSIWPHDDFMEFNQTVTDDECLDINQKKKRITDEEAIKKLLDISRCKSKVEFDVLPTKEKMNIVSVLHEEGISERQLCRITGMSRGIVKHAVVAL